MCQQIHAQAIFLPLVLISMAIQGVTPDPQDLASLNALRLFCPGLLAFPGSSDDELPDDVSGPADSGSDIMLRRIEESHDSHQPGLSSAPQNAQHSQAQALRTTTTKGNFAQPACALENLCKRNC